MNCTTFRKFQKGITSIMHQLVILKSLQTDNHRGIHQICNQQFLKLTATFSNKLKPMNFLTPILPQFNQDCGMKQKGFLNLQCKSCHFVVRQGRRYVVCKAKAAHKQMQPIKKFKNVQILTFASQKKIRDWL